MSEIKTKINEGHKKGYEERKNKEYTELVNILTAAFFCEEQAFAIAEAIMHRDKEYEPLFNKLETLE